MVEFDRDLKRINGQYVGYVRPLSAVTEADWIALFESDLAGLALNEFLLIVDIIDVDEEFGLTGMSKFVELIKKQGFGRTRIAVLPPNRFYPVVLKLFEQVAKQHDVDFQARAFDNRDQAEDWLCGEKVALKVSAAR
jgi:hypothetical protein